MSIVKCDRYSDCLSYIKHAVDLIGGMEKFIKKGDKVVIKPNLVSKRNPNDAVTTHPDFVNAVIRLAEDAGGIVTIAESPGGPYNVPALKMIYNGCMMDKAIEGTNAALNYNTEFKEVSFPEGKIVKSFPIINPILDADVIISLPKLKTHAMTSYTGAVKNLFGVIPGTHKAELHFRLNERKPFCSMLVDICEFVKPTLSIMDGIWGMEGNGPTAGKNRHTGLIMASQNPYSLDLAACTIIGYDPKEVDTVLDSINRGLTAKEPIIKGELIENVLIKDFEKPESHFNLLKLISLPDALNAKLTSALASRPQINTDKCVGCGECMRCCPPHAIEMLNKRPKINTSVCIKCFCCQELCPKQAVQIKRPLLNKIMLSLLK